MKLLPPNLFRFILLLSVSAIFSSFTLWLLEESSIKFTLFGTEMGIIIVIYLILNNYDLRSIVFKNRLLSNIFSSLSSSLFSKLDVLADLLFVVSSIILIVFAVFPSHGVLSIIQLLLAFSCTSFFVGFAVLNIFKINRYLSTLEYIVLSYVTSFILSGLLTIGLLSVDENIRDIPILILFLSIGLISVIYRIKYKQIHDNSENTSSLSRHRSLCNNIDILAILVSIVFFSIFFFIAYPDFALIPNNDITRHYNNFVILSRTPDLYTGFNYILFHGFQATLNVLSGLNQPVASFQTIQVVLNLFLPLAVYIFAKRYFSGIDERIPALATIFYSVFSNFAFIYFVKLKLVDASAGSNTLELLRNTAEHTLNGTIYFLQPFTWFTPLSVSFVIFIVSFFLLRLEYIPRKKFVILFAVLILSLNLVHVSEGVLLIIFIVFVSFLTKSKVNSINDILLSSLIGNLGTNIFILCEFLVWPNHLNIDRIDVISLISFVMTIFITFSLFYRLKFLPKLSKVVFSKYGKLIIFRNLFLGNRLLSNFLLSLLIFTYFFGLVIWIITDDFKTSLFAESGFVPWFVYPSMLGIVGIMAIISLKYIKKFSIKNNHGIFLVILAISVIFVIGRIISFLNTHNMYLGYWENRLVLVIFLFASSLAPLPLIKLSDRLNTGTSLILPSFYISITISLMVLLGYSSSILQYDYYHITVNDKKISEKESQAIKFLKKALQDDNHAFIIAPSAYSNHVINLASSPLFYKNDLIVSSKYPDIPLLAFSSFDLTHAYLYIHSRDISLLNKNPHNWLVEHLLPILPIVYSNGEVTIYNITHINHPGFNSNTTLVYPTDYANNRWLYTTDILIQNKNVRFTEELDTDPHIFNRRNVILSFDPGSAYTFFSDFNLKENSVQWDKVTGIWKFNDTDGLHGESNYAVRKGGTNIILSSFIFKNLSSIDLSLRINDVNVTQANYASIVYSFLDLWNYKQAGINVYHGNIYVLSSTMSNGTLHHDNAWPGINTGLRWKPGGIHLNMELAFNGTRNVLNLNDTQYLLPSGETVVKSGKVGLSYEKVKDIIFHRFESHDYDKINLREISDYIQYVKDGGNLFILNTNGYSSIYSYLNSNSNEKTLSKYLKFSFNNFSTYYGIPVVKENLGNGSITYIDIYPLLMDYFHNRVSSGMLLSLFKNISSILPSDYLDPPDLNFNHLHIFYEMIGKGKIKIKTSSIIFTNETIKTIIINQANSNHTLSNVSRLHASNYDDSVIDLGSGQILANDGKGLYGKVILDSNDKSYKIQFPTGSSIQGITNKQTFKFENVSNIYINKQPISLYVKQPYLKIDGSVILKNYYDFNKFLISNQDATQASNFVRMMDGTISFNIIMSDFYSIFNNFSNTGDTYRIPPIYPYNEIGFLNFDFILKLLMIPTLVWILIVSLVILAIIFLLTNKKR